MKLTRHMPGSHSLHHRCAAFLVLSLVLSLTMPLPSHAPAGDDPALVYAASRGKADEVRALLLVGADPDSLDEQGRTALIRATTAGHLQVVEILLKAQANVNATDRNGLTALFEAVRLGHVNVARALLEAGAEPDVRYRAFGTALDIAERQGASELMTLLRSRGARGSGKSVGDLVCVRPWDGQGYCGTVMAVEGSHWVLRVTRLVGCAGGCAPDACSMRRPVGGEQADSVQVGDEMRVEGACLTHTGLRPEEQPE